MESRTRLQGQREQDPPENLSGRDKQNFWLTLPQKLESR